MICLFFRKDPGVDRDNFYRVLVSWPRTTGAHIQKPKKNSCLSQAVNVFDKIKIYESKPCRQEWRFFSQYGNIKRNPMYKEFFCVYLPPHANRLLSSMKYHVSWAYNFKSSATVFFTFEDDFNTLSRKSFENDSLSYFILSLCWTEFTFSYVVNASGNELRNFSVIGHSVVSE